MAESSHNLKEIDIASSIEDASFEALKNAKKEKANDKQKNAGVEKIFDIGIAKSFQQHGFIQLIIPTQPHRGMGILPMREKMDA